MLTFIDISTERVNEPARSRQF